VPPDRNAALRTAEKLLRQGKLDAAIAEYVRLVDEQPRDWNTANALGDLYVRKGDIDRAVEQFTRVADSLADEGFLPKANAIYKKVLKLKPLHEYALIRAAEIAASQGLLVDARTYLTMVIERRRSRGDARGAAEAQVRLGKIDPSDYQARIAATSALVALGDLAGAVSDLKELAAELFEKDRTTESAEVLRQAAALAPDDPEIQERLARALGGSEELHEPAPSLTEETAGGNPELLLVLAEARIRGGDVEQGVALARRVLEEHADWRDRVAVMGCAVAEHAPDAAFAVVELAADAAAAANDCASAAAALQEFVTRVPHHLAALMRLVEIAVEGGLEATMYSAQVQLADAYLDAGMAIEARFIAEDLVAREPWERANLERFRRALELLGVADPDAVIAERLSGQSPFMVTDLFAPAELLGVPAEETAPAASAEGTASPAPEPPVPSAAAAAATPASATAHAISDTVEVDLSIVLNELPGVGAAPRPVALSGDIDDVFAQLRDEASRRSTLEFAEAEYVRALALEGAGQLDECVQALQAAVRAPARRFDAAWRLARVLRGQGNARAAAEWFERAAQAQPPSAEDGHALLYELAEVLEEDGEVARALAVCLELQADAGAYRDVTARIDRLTRVQAGG
jgi:tetratricopeptide (TPR) repeat protein